MKTLYIPKLDPVSLMQIQAFLCSGKIIAFPTETVYGIGALLSEEKAIFQLSLIKQRTSQKALTLHLGSLEQVKLVAKEIPDDFYLLAQHFMPGPLTVILKKQKQISSLVSPFETIGVRMPSHPDFLKIARSVKEPVVGTSANLTKAKALFTSQEVYDLFQGQIAAVVNGQKSLFKMPSTVISLTGSKPLILREGVLKKAQIEAVLQNELAFL
jgi:L-threonylcarbamoyladenylate synthase